MRQRAPPRCADKALPTAAVLLAAALPHGNAKATPLPAPADDFDGGGRPGNWNMCPDIDITTGED